MRVILAFNFTAERLKALKLAALLVKAQVRLVAPADYLQNLGYLAGLKGFTAQALEYTDAPPAAEALYLCGFDRMALDKLLNAIRKGPLRQIDLKAIETPTNARWTPLKLLKELADEHAYLQKVDRKLLTIHSLGAQDAAAGATASEEESNNG